jgi:ABC-type amino acid transport system permease subunit
MDTATMLTTATYLFAAAALGGIIIALMRFSGIPRPPLWFAMGHGVSASAGQTLLIYAACMGEVPQMVQLAAVLFLGAALGGAALNLLYHAKGLALPIPLIIGHGLVAAIALGLLWFGAGRPLPF